MILGPDGQPARSRDTAAFETPSWVLRETAERFNDALGFARLVAPQIYGPDGRALPHSGVGETITVKLPKRYGKVDDA